MRPWLLAFVLIGCGDAKTDTGTTTESDADADADSDADTDTSACTELTEGGWTADGSCVGMMMTATLTVAKSDSCSFTLDEWDMAMDVPTGGTIVGTDVTLTGGGNWDTCTGTTDGVSISGTCGDGCNFELAVQ